MPELEVAQEIGPNAGLWKELLLNLPWAPVNGEPLPKKIGFALMITMENMPISTELLTIINFARQANCGVFASTDLQELLGDNATKECCLPENETEAAPAIEKAPRRKRRSRVPAYEQP